MCEFDGVNNTCWERIRWATTHDKRDEKHPCGEARALVLSQCAICGGCSFKAMGCHVTEEKYAEIKEKYAEQKDRKEKHAKADKDDGTVVILKKPNEPADLVDQIEGASEPVRTAVILKKSDEGTVLVLKRFEESAEVEGSSAWSTGLGFFARSSLAGIAAGVPLAIVFRRTLRTVLAVPETQEQVYEQPSLRGDEEQAHE